MVQDQNPGEDQLANRCFWSFTGTPLLCLLLPVLINSRIKLFGNLSLVGTVPYCQLLHFPDWSRYY